MIALIDRLFGASVADALRAPFVLGDADAFAATFEAAAIPVRIETLPGTACFPSIDDWVQTDVRGWTLADLIDDDGYRRLLDAARVDLRPFAAADDGPVAFAAPALAGVAVKP